MIEVNRTAVELFGLSMHWYGVLIVLGIALGVCLASAREKRYGLAKDTALDLALICVPAAILGARLYYVIFSWADYSAGPWWRIFAVWEGGLAIYGGVIGGLLTGACYAKVKKLSFLALADLAAPCIALGQAIGRWGNFVNQEAHGGPVGNPALRFFPMAVEIAGEWYYATFFYESVWCFLIVAALLLAERKWKNVPGGILFGYVFLYGLERGLVEGLRTDSLMLGPVRVSQALGLLAAAGAAMWMAAQAKRAPAWLRAVTLLLTPMALICVHAGLPWTSVGAVVLSLIACAAMLHIHYKRDQIENRGEKI